MGVEVGSVLEGKVTGITKFGAFVALPGGKSGLVHISEIANSYVAEVSDHVQLGQSVKVKVLSVSPEGKINLSIKRAAEPASAPREQTYRRPAPARQETDRRSTPVGTVDPPTGDQAFEDRLKKFMQESDSRIADNRYYADRSRRSRRHS